MAFRTLGNNLLFGDQRRMPPLMTIRTGDRCLMAGTSLLNLMNYLRMALDTITAGELRRGWLLGRSRSLLSRPEWTC